MRSTTQVSITQVSIPAATATQVVAARSGRSLLYLYTPNDLVLGQDNTVTTSTGMPFSQLASPTALVKLETQAAFWAYSANPATIAVMELHD